MDILTDGIKDFVLFILAALAGILALYILARKR